MANKNKQKGNAFERKLVNLCKEHGLEAKRSWGSDGRSMGEEKEVDCIINGYKIQCKKGYQHPTAKLKGFLENVDMCVWGPSDARKHNNSDFVIMHIDMFIKLLKGG